MKKLITIFLLNFLVFTSSVKAEPVVTLEPKELTQGHHFFIEFFDDKNSNKQELFVEFNNLNFKMFRKKDNKYVLYLGTPADMKKGDYPLKIVDSKKELIFQTLVNIKEGNFGTQNISYYRPKLTKEQIEKIKAEDLLVDSAKKTLSEEQLWTDSFTLPVKDKVSGIYGIKRYLNGNYNNYHTGVDFASAMRTPIKATNNGIVILAKYFSKYNANGNIVFLDHGHGVTSIYLHLSKMIVTEGEKVNKGQTIGYVGSSGRSTGPHLHWGLYLNGQNTDGLNWVKFSSKFLKDKKNIANK